MSKQKTLSNREIVSMSFPCGCIPHEEIKTFKAWIKEGRVVKKGEKATKLHAFIQTKEKDEKTGKVEDKEFLNKFKANVFCKCQTQELTKEGEAE